MKKNFLHAFFILVTFAASGQITLIGHCMLNNMPIKNTRITVKQGSVVSKTLDTRNSADFKLQLEFGKIYQVYFQNRLGPVMHLEVRADNIPEDKYEYRMTYEMNIPFVNLDDEDIDTTVFRRPFHRVIYNGKTRMVDDAAYNNAFARTIVRAPVKEVKEQPVAALPVTVAGKVRLNAGTSIPVINSKIDLIGHQGQVLKTTSTNRFGAFAFTNIRLAEVGRIRMSAGGGEQSPRELLLLNSQNKLVVKTAPLNGQCEWQLDQPSAQKLVDNYFTTNIGGKLVVASPKEKKFFADKDIYLCNRLNTVIKTTRTNILGTFVFEDIKPDLNYFIGVSRSDVNPGEKIDLLSKEDTYIATLDSITSNRHSLPFRSDYNKVFNDVSIGDEEMKMDVKATIFGDNVNTPIGKLKVILLNDQYEVIDSAITDDLGSFRFKYLPFLKRFFLSAENTDNMLDVFKNILIYSSDDNLIKIMTHQKGKKFSYNPIQAEMTRLRDLELEDPWLELMDDHRKPAPEKAIPAGGKSIVEKILFDNNKYDITPQAREVLDKIILVLSSNRKLRLEIGAHTDSKGSNEANYKLSQLRAETVRNYLAAAGIEQRRVSAKGYGETKLLNGCGDGVPCSELEHAQNRRIDFKILDE